jgi:hypothetical protein
MEVNDIELALAEFVTESYEGLRTPIRRSQQFNTQPDTRERISKSVGNVFHPAILGVIVASYETNARIHL